MARPRHTYWTIRQAIAWLQFEDEGECERLSPENDSFSASAEAFYGKRPIARQSFQAAEAALLAKLRDGTVIAFNEERDLPIQFWRTRDNLRVIMKNPEVRVPADVISGRSNLLPTDLVVQTTSAQGQKTRGPKPKLTESIISKMLIDYADDPTRLEKETEESLVACYSSVHLLERKPGTELSRDTVRRARVDVLLKLRQTPTETPTIDK